MTPGCNCAVCQSEREHMDAIDAMSQALSGAADDFIGKGIHPGDVANAFGIVLAMLCKTHKISASTAKNLFGLTVDSVYVIDDMAQAQERAGKKGH